LSDWYGVGKMFPELQSDRRARTEFDRTCTRENPQTTYFDETRPSADAGQAA